MPIPLSLYITKGYTIFSDRMLVNPTIISSLLDFASCIFCISSLGASSGGTCLIIFWYSARSFVSILPPARVVYLRRPVYSAVCQHFCKLVCNCFLMHCIYCPKIVAYAVRKFCQNLFFNRRKHH